MEFRQRALISDVYVRGEGMDDRGHRKRTLSICRPSLDSCPNRAPLVNLGPSAHSQQPLDK